MLWTVVGISLRVYKVVAILRLEHVDSVLHTFVARHEKLSLSGVAMRTVANLFESICAFELGGVRRNEVLELVPLLDAYQWLQLLCRLESRPIQNTD